MERKICHCCGSPMVRECKCNERMGEDRDHCRYICLICSAICNEEDLDTEDYEKKEKSEKLSD